MKKIVCLLVSYVILGLGVAFAQEITSLQYFKGDFYKLNP